MAGDVKITLGGAAFIMRPAYNVYRDIEGRLDLPMPGVLKLAITRHLKLDEAAVIVVSAANEAREGLEYEAVEKRLYEGGFVNNPQLIGPVIKLLLELLYTAPGVAAKKFEAEVEPMLQEIASVQII